MEHNGTTPKPDNYLVWAILSTVLCCLPIGIVSIVHSAKVDGLYNSGNYGEAQEAADKAKKWAIYSAIAAGIFWVIYILIFVVAGVTMASI